MDRAARETVVNAGVDVDALIDKLVAAAGAEFAAGYYFTILRMRSVGLDGEGLHEVIEDARVEDRNHFEALVPRIYELGGKLPDDIRAFADRAGCPDAYPPGSPGLGGVPGTEDLLTVLVEAERCAIRTYTDICHFTAGKDHRTYELALAILNEKIEHEAWFSELLGEGPSGHFRRGGPGESPYVGRFMTAEGASR